MTETIFNILKVSVITVICSVFMIAINTIINLIATVVFSNVVGEVLGIISCCLPFNALAVFGAICTATSGILAFLVSKKIFELTSWSISSI